MIILILGIGFLSSCQCGFTDRFQLGFPAVLRYNNIRSKARSLLCKNTAGSELNYFFDCFIPLAPHISSLVSKLSMTLISPMAPAWNRSSGSPLPARTLRAWQVPWTPPPGALKRSSPYIFHSIRSSLDQRYNYAHWLYRIVPDFQDVWTNYRNVFWHICWTFSPAEPWTGGIQDIQIATAFLVKLFHLLRCRLLTFL